MVLKLYYDLMSQPSRAVYLFLKAANIPFEARPVALQKGEHLTDAFTEINPFQRVPAIDHDGFKLTESVAILRYLCAQFSHEDHWYPSNVWKRARVDEYMSWQHTTLRIQGSMFFQYRVIRKPFNREKVDTFRSGLDGVLSQMEAHLLGSQFVNGFDEITIADLICVCELEQTICGGGFAVNDAE